MFQSISSAITSCRNSCDGVLDNILPFNQVNPGNVTQNLMGQCEFCGIRFSFVRRRKLCTGCGLGYCSSCLQNALGSQRQCRKCIILSHWPVNKEEISSLRVRDLRYYLNSCKIPTTTYKEKQELINLVISHLKHKRYVSSQDFRPTNVTRSLHSSPDQSVRVRDDGIRVRPMNTNVSEERNNERTEDADGIRIFSATDSYNRDSSIVTENLSERASLNSNPESPEENGAIALALNPDSVSLKEPDQNPTENLQPVIDTPEPSIDTKPKKTGVDGVVKLSSLITEDSINDLTIRQCKEVLLLYRVDFSGVFEKHELLGKVKLLWHDYQHAIKEKKNLSEEQLCKICMDAAMDCVFLECGHIACCTFCGKQMAECPICRQNVVRIVKTFKA